MKIRVRIILLLVLLLLVALFSYGVSVSHGFVVWYSVHVFRPFQIARQSVFGLLPFSFGDVLYILMGMLLLVILLRLVYFAMTFGRHKEKLGLAIVDLLLFVFCLVLWFQMGWGGNYYKPELLAYWSPASVQERSTDTAALFRFHEKLTDRLVVLAPQYRPLPEKEINSLAASWYYDFTDRGNKRGLGIKHTMFGVVLERLGIDGYYNPFTGEGQINGALPDFMKPFLFTHDMAHQAGIADEEDANLLAYALGTLTDDPTFRYSAALNVWLYVHARVMRRDTVAGKACLNRLRPLTRAHLDTLDELAHKYDNAAARMSTDAYDVFLKANNQQAGVRGYGYVARSARLWEDMLRKEGRRRLRLP